MEPGSLQDGHMAPSTLQNPSPYSKSRPVDSSVRICVHLSQVPWRCECQEGTHCSPTQSSGRGTELSLHLLIRDRKAELHEEVQPGNELMQTARSRPSIEKMVWRVPRLRFLKAAGTCCQCTRVFSVG